MKFTLKIFLFLVTISVALSVVIILLFSCRNDNSPLIIEPLAIIVPMDLENLMFKNLGLSEMKFMRDTV
jgi:hypothetical protein